MTNEDIVIQLRSTITWEPHVGRLLDAAAKEIERLRAAARDTPRTAPEAEEQHGQG